jgi:hypothetical protein
LFQNFTEVETSKLYKISLMITSEKLVKQFQEHHCSFCIWPEGPKTGPRPFFPAHPSDWAEQPACAFSNAA